jgi:deoxyhypusine synthase
MKGLDRPVKDINLEKIESISDLLSSYEDAGGFMARSLGEAYKILLTMYRERENVTIFMSFPADIVATGLRGVLRDVVRNSLVDVIITTCGTLDHDLARSYRDYYLGDFYMDDKELRDREIHRLGNVLVPMESYGIIIEEKMKEFLNMLYNEGVREISTHKLVERLGRHINNENSILYWAYKNKIPVIIPGPYDGAVGYQIWQFQQFKRDFTLNLFGDESLMSGKVFEAEKTGGIILGGGISKHHLLWWNQFRGGLDYAVQITTGIELDGSLTGARLSEAVTWGKIKKEGLEVSVWGDVTIIFPLLVKGILEII